MLQYTGDRDMQTLGSPRVVGASPHVYDHTFSCAWRHGCAAPAAAHPSCLSWGHTPPACGARPTTNISVRRVVFGSAARQHTGRSPALSGCKLELSLCVCVCVCDFNGWRRRAGHPPAEEVVGVALGCKGGLVHGRHLARKFRRHGAQLDHARRLVHAVRLRFPPPLTAIVQPAPTPHPHTQVSRPSRTHAHHQQACVRQMHSDQRQNSDAKRPTASCARGPFTRAACEACTRALGRFSAVRWACVAAVTRRTAAWAPPAQASSAALVRAPAA